MASDDHLESGFGDLQSLLKGQGYSQGQSDHTVLTKYSNRGNIVTTLIVCGWYKFERREDMIRLKNGLAKEIEIKYLVQLQYFFGMEVAR